MPNDRMTINIAGVGSECDVDAIMRAVEGALRNRRAHVASHTSSFGSSVTGEGGGGGYGGVRHPVEIKLTGEAFSREAIEEMSLAMREAAGDGRLDVLERAAPGATAAAMQVGRFKSGSPPPRRPREPDRREPRPPQGWIAAWVAGFVVGLGLGMVGSVTLILALTALGVQ